MTIIAHKDLVFGTSGAGLPYGSQYLHEGSQTVTISSADTYYKITGLTDGLLNAVTITDDAFRVVYPGIYKINWCISLTTGGANLIYDTEVFINGVEQADGACRQKFPTAATLTSMSGSGVFDITDSSHDIDLRIEQVGGVATDVDLFHANFNLIMIGGT